MNPRLNHPLRRAAEALHGRVLADKGDGLYFVPATGLRIFATEDEIRAWLNWVPVAPSGLGASLHGLRNRPMSAAEIALFCEGLKLWELNAPPSAWDAYEKSLRQLAAVCLRQNTGGGLYAAWTALALQSHSNGNPV